MCEGKRNEKCACLVVHGFLWQNGKMIDLGVLPHRTKSEAFDINERGQVIGWSWSASLPKGYGFVWQNGKMVGLGRPSKPFAINERGQVVGATTGPSSQGGGHAVLWTYRP